MHMSTVMCIYIVNATYFASWLIDVVSLLLDGCGYCMRPCIPLTSIGTKAHDLVHTEGMIALVVISTRKDSNRMFASTKSTCLYLNI